MPGSRHDSEAINLYGWQDLLDSSGATWIADTAYIATTAITPIKKLPNQSRTKHDKTSTLPSPESASTSKTASHN